MKHKHLVKRMRHFLIYGLVLPLVSSLVMNCSHPEQKDAAVPQPVDTPAQETFVEVMQKLTPEDIAALKNYTIACGNQQIDLAGPVGEIAASLEMDSLLYATEPLSDCSGIFHRVLKAMNERCPDHTYPAVEDYRDTRDLARWYSEQEELILIQDALSSEDYLKPGAVLFYGQRDSVYTNFGVEELLQPKTGINHMGVVVAVHKNEAGEVVQYELFHGHGSPGRTPASTTNYHLRVPTRPEYPVFGNGHEQWVAFAPIVKLPEKLVTVKQ
ncbi:hypothetical protein KC799_17585 [candidate division KSB1 bacterium]|nr:hypothetical protein [candidate division KSB1 bacterium]